MKKLILIQFVIVLLLSSCLVGKKYSRPAVNTPGDYNNHDSTVIISDTVVNAEWFNLFKDPVLNQLITQALDTNTDLRIAALRIEQSRSFYGISKANVLPSIGYSGTAQISDPDADNFNLMGTAAWELDFWGKLRHAKRASYAQLMASEEGYKALKTAIVSDVAIQYFSMRDLDNRVDVAKRTLISRQLYYDMVNERFLKGEVAEIDKLQAEQQLALVDANLRLYQRQLDETERSLNILLGQNPELVARGLENAEQTLPPEIPAGLPSTLLSQRPDVRAAEENLIAETERIGVTQAMRLPSFNLTGLLGVASADINTLFSGDAVAGSLSGLVLGPIFEFGKNKQRVNIQKAEAEIALNNYVNIYRIALGEVEHALVAIKTYREEYAARTRQVEAARRALMLTKAKYDSGYTSYLEVLIAESYTFDAEIATSLTRSQQLAATVQLYRALGGGW